jgi:hypothetical protein
MCIRAGAVELSLICLHKKTIRFAMTTFVLFDPLHICALDLSQLIQDLKPQMRLVIQVGMLIG